MSLVFGDEQEQRQQLQTLTAGWDGQNESEPGAFEGVGTGFGSGIMRGGAKAADFVQTLGSFFDPPGTDSQAVDEIAGQIRRDSIDYWTPDAREVGKVGEVLGAVSEIALPLAVTGGNPSMLIGSQSISTGKDLIDQGVDADTALKVAVTEGAAIGLGAWLPFFGSTIAKRVAIGAGANAAIGVASRGAEGGILSGAGYEQQAQQYDAFDLQAIAVDTLMGGAFGVLYRGQAPDLASSVIGAEGSATREAVQAIASRIRPSDIDAIFSAANVKNWQIDSAPGRPVDSASWRQHSQAQEVATQQLLTGQSVDVSSSIQAAEFTARKPEVNRDVLESVLSEPEGTYRTAYHGSPHIFEDFSLSKMGTGEGVQAYGFGLYFAGNKGVADQYRQGLTSASAEPSSLAARVLEASDGNPEAAIKDLRSRVGPQSDADFKQRVDDAIASIEDGSAFGRLYEARIPGDEMLLDWDSSLSAQPENVIQGLKSSGLYDEAGAQSATGQDLYQSLIERYGGGKEGKRLASEALNKAGIPGLRYLDGASRAAGDGDRNYVIWDDQAVQTLNRRRTADSPVESVAPAPGDAAFYERDSFDPQNQKPVAQDPDAVAIDSALQLLDERGDFNIQIAADSTDGEAGITRSVRDLLNEADDGITTAQSLGDGIMAAARCFIGLGAE